MGSGAVSYTSGTYIFRMYCGNLSFRCLAIVLSRFTGNNNEDCIFDGGDVSTTWNAKCDISSIR